MPQTHQPLTQPQPQTTPHPNPNQLPHPTPDPTPTPPLNQNVTWEGDNNVLCLQTARFMLKAMAASAKPGGSDPAANGSAAYLAAGALRRELGARCEAKVRWWGVRGCRWWVEVQITNLTNPRGFVLRRVIQQGFESGALCCRHIWQQNTPPMRLKCRARRAGCSPRRSWLRCATVPAGWRPMPLTR